MSYLSRNMNDYHLEQQFQRQIDELRDGMERRLEELERPPRATPNYVASPNYILNSHPEWSKAAWETANVVAGTVTNDNRTCYNWYYQTQANSAQNLASSSSLIADGHTSFASLPADAPIWDRENGHFVTGHQTSASAVYDIACRLPRDFVFPGQRYFVYFETIALESTLDLLDAQVYCGFWDNTSTQRKWIEGGDFTPTYSIFGAGGTRTLKYKILAATDGGDEIISNELTVANAPNELTPTNHVRLFFQGAPGFISFKVYRFDGATYRQVADIRNSIDLQFFDMQETIGSLQTGYPTISTQRPLAKVTTSSLSAVPNSYTAHTLVIQVPTTYNRSNTVSEAPSYFPSQWFRFGVTAPMSATRKLGIRRIMVSEGYGPWVRAQADLTEPLSGPSTTASSAPPPGIVIGGTPGGGSYCVTLDTLVEVMTSINGVDVIESVPISEITTKSKMVSGLSVLPVLQIKDGTVQEVYTIYTKRGFVLTCSASHRIVKSRLDTQGTAAMHLKIGDKVLISEEGLLAQDEIDEITLTVAPTQVRTVSLPAPHLFVTNGIISHNNKIDPQLEYNAV